MPHNIPVAPVTHDDIMAEARRVVETALAEDVGRGDVTSNAVIPADAHFEGIMRAREDMVVAGLMCAEIAFHTLDPACTWTARLQDGDRAKPGEEIARVSGNARALLTAERTALNILQHLSGIATLTRHYVDAIDGTGARVKDTRKTVPGLRVLAKYASRMGGAVNHRMRLDDAILIKDNHIAVAGGVAAAVVAAKSAALPVQVECDTLEELRAALDAGADSVLLDNMAPDTLREAVAIVGGRVETEASGGVRLETIRAIAESGVTYVSVGRITQSAPAIDIGLDWDSL